MIKQALFITLLVATLLIGVTVQAQTWTAPLVEPPDGNTPPPINVSINNQVKSGGLSIGSLLVTGQSAFKNYTTFEANMVNRLIALFNGVGTTGGYSRIGVNAPAGTDPQISFLHGGTTWWSLGAEASDNTLHARYGGGGAFSATDKLILTGTGKLTTTGTAADLCIKRGTDPEKCLSTTGGTMSSFTLQGFNGIGLKEGGGAITTAPVTVNDGDAITVQMGQCVSGSIFKSVNGQWACYGNQPGEFVTDACAPGQVLKLDANNIWKCGTDNAGTTGGGSVTSVGLSAPNIFAVSDSPVTTTGTLGLALVSQLANTVFAGPPSGAAAVPSFRALTANDIPTGQRGDIVGAGGITVTNNAERLIGSTNATISVDPALIQTRVSGACKLGESIRVINQDGTVQCEPDDTGSGGDGVVDSIGVSGTDTKTITLGRSGTLTDLTAQFTDNDTLGSVPTTSCGSGQVLKWNGTGWACADDNNTGTTYTAGTGIAISGTNVISATDAVVGNEVTGATASKGLVRAGSGTAASPYTLGVNFATNCTGTNQKLLYNGSTGAWSCGTDAVGDPGTPSSGLTTNFLPKWNGSALINSFAHDEPANATKGERTEFDRSISTREHTFVDGTLFAKGGAVIVGKDGGGFPSILVTDLPELTALPNQSLLIVDNDNGSVRKIDPSLVIPSLGPVTTRVGVYMDMTGTSEGCFLESGIPLYDRFSFYGGLDQGNYNTAFKTCNNRFKGLSDDGLTTHVARTAMKNNYLKYMAFRFKKSSCSISQYLSEAPTASDYVQLVIAGNNNPSTEYVASEIVLTCS